jgi:hypothetical protein
LLVITFCSLINFHFVFFNCFFCLATMSLSQKKISLKSILWYNLGRLVYQRHFVCETQCLSWVRQSRSATQFNGFGPKNKQKPKI